MPVEEFLRRFLLHVLPDGFHRIRHYGFLAAGARADIERIRAMIGGPSAEVAPSDPTDAGGVDEQAAAPEFACPCCGGRMRIVEIFARGQTPKTPTATRLWADTS